MVSTFSGSTANGHIVLDLYTLVVFGECGFRVLGTRPRSLSAWLFAGKLPPLPRPHRGRRAIRLRAGSGIDRQSPAGRATATCGGPGLANWTAST